MNELKELVELLTSGLIELLFLVGFITLVIILIIKQDKKSKIKIEQLREEYKSNSQPTATPQQTSTPTNQQKVNFPYKAKDFLLTLRESDFYRKLKPVADKYNLTIMCKMRIADIIDVKDYFPNKRKWFSRISQKHIDFILCNQFFKPIILIEVDDSTHNRPDRIESDNFKNEVFQNLRIPLLRYRIWTEEMIDNDILSLLGIKKDEKTVNQQVENV